MSSRRVQWVLLAAASLSAIALFLLATASANTQLFAQSYDTLLVLNFALVGVLFAIVLWQLALLRRNLRRGVFGSRLAVRLVSLFALVAVLPGALVYAVSVQFLGRSIESWFDVRVDRALEGGLNVGRAALDSLLVLVQHELLMVVAAPLLVAPCLVAARGGVVALARAGVLRRGTAVLVGGGRPRHARPRSDGARAALHDHAAHERTRAAADLRAERVVRARGAGAVRHDRARGPAARRSGDVDVRRAGLCGRRSRLVAAWLSPRRTGTQRKRLASR
jgi:nitrogen fixation/metabolism regulation signal transduction histidine kinase